jgi:protein ImuB
MEPGAPGASGASAASGTSGARDAAALDAAALDRMATRALVRCAQWCMRWTPRVHLETTHGPPAIVLDLTGCLPVHGGVARVRRRLAHVLERRGIAHTIGVASTAGGALAVGLAAALERDASPAPHAPPASPAHAGTVARAAPATLSALPVHALRLPAATVEALHEVHIRTVGHLLALDRGALADRFGPCVAERLDALVGDRPWPFHAVPAPDLPRAEFVFASPCARLEAVQRAMDHAVERLCAELERRARCASTLQVRVERAGMPAVRGVIHLGVPTRGAAHLRRLLAPRVERMPLGCHEHGMGVERIEIVALRMGTAHADAAHQALGHLVDHLEARLGAGSVREAWEACQPEEAPRA